MNQYECDVCGTPTERSQLATVVAYGIDTTVCNKCRGVDEEDQDTESTPGKLIGAHGFTDP